MFHKHIIHSGEHYTIIHGDCQDWLHDGLYFVPEIIAIYDTILIKRF